METPKCVYSDPSLKKQLGNRVCFGTQVKRFINRKLNLPYLPLLADVSDDSFSLFLQQVRVEGGNFRPEFGRI